MSSWWLKPPNKFFYNQNEGHLGSRYKHTLFGFSRTVAASVEKDLPKFIVHNTVDVYLTIFFLCQHLPRWFRRLILGHHGSHNYWELGSKWIISSLEVGCKSSK